jgi:hypothetical protein
MTDLPADWPNHDRVKTQPRYPVYVPTVGRYLNPLTIKTLMRWDVPFYAVVEPKEAEQYANFCGPESILVLPENFSERREGAIPARNWIKQHSIDQGDERHWQLDDNIREFRRLYRGMRLDAPTGTTLRVIEDFTDRYENIGVSGPNYTMFGITAKQPPVVTNAHVYSACLYSNSVDAWFRGPMNEDTDMCLQVLALGYCTALVNVFLAYKVRTMVMKGGYTDKMYDADGRLRMARTLERRWPRVVTTERRWERPQHVVRGSWRYFDTPLKLKPGIDLDAMPKVDEYGLVMTAVGSPGEHLKSRVGLD